MYVRCGSEPLPTSSVLQLRHPEPLGVRRPRSGPLALRGDPSPQAWRNPGTGGDPGTGALAMLPCLAMVRLGGRRRSVRLLLPLFLLWPLMLPFAVVLALAGL